MRCIFPARIAFRSGEDAIEVVLGEKLVRGRRDGRGWSFAPQGGGRAIRVEPTECGRALFEGERAAIRSFHPPGPPGVVEATYLMQADGRLFRCAQRGLRAVRMELTDWETGAPFLEAEPADGGWDVAVGPAGAQLDGLLPVAVLWAVELHEADAP